MIIQITIDTTTLTTEDAAVLAALLPGVKPAATETLKTPAPVAKPVAKATPAAKPVAKPVARPAAKATPVEEPVAEEEPAIEEQEEDVVGVAAPTMADAVERASKLVSQNKTAGVKAALTDIGVRRVSELKDDQIKEFLDAVESL